MYKKQTMDRGIRIMGGCVLIGLVCVGGGGIDSIDKIVAISVGLYGLLTGIANFCPVGYIIMKEKRQNRKKSSADRFIEVNNVRDLYFFQSLSDAEIVAVLAYCQMKTYPLGATVVRQGTHRKVLSIIYSGHFKIEKSIAEGETKLIGTIKDGETFGEQSFFDHQAPSVSVVSLEDSKVLEIDEAGFDELIGTNQQLGIKILNCLLHITSRRIRAMDDQIASLGNWVVHSRQNFREPARS